VVGKEFESQKCKESKAGNYWGQRYPMVRYTYEANHNHLTDVKPLLKRVFYRPQNIHIGDCTDQRFSVRLEY
jgi:hypothetical protein